MYDVLIIGSGPAGLSAAIYGKRALLDLAVIEKDYMGTGQIAVTEQVDNYPGLPGISGYDLGEKLRSHAEQLGTEFIEAEVTGLEKSADGWQVALSGGKTETARAVIYAAGASHRKPGVPGGDKQRISYCAVCDGFFYKDKTVAVIGGGDTALGDALYLSKLAKTVYLVHRRDEFRANKSLQKRVADTENIVPVLGAVLTGITGADSADGIDFTQDNEQKHLAVDGVFVAIGSVPNTAPLQGICELDGGYVVAGEDCVTSAPGLFAAGDIRTTPLRQVITAAADGANAINSVEKYLNS
ncbi:MAG: FAD-dependent oxidoreductase [Oscillospiraceae bacterium]|nr:FAD-dependent oxidoreductase [Oscillospiraceae bacterium]